MEKTKEKDTGTRGSNSTIQLIVFRQGQEEYALRIDQIKEVVITPGITRMPQTPSYVKGVANIRGNIIAIIDLEEKFGLEKAQENSTGKNFTLVIESENLKVGILVKEVPNTLSVSLNDIEEGVNMVQVSSEQNYISGIIKKDERLIILMDILKVVEVSDVSSFSKVTN